MTLCERAARGVLAREAHPRALRRKRRERERFSISPIERNFLACDLQARLQKLFDLRMRLEIFRKDCLLLQELFQFILGHSSLDFVFGFGAAEVSAPYSAEFLRQW